MGVRILLLVSSEGKEVGGTRGSIQVSFDGQEVASASGWADAGTGRQRKDLSPVVYVWGEVDTHTMVGAPAQ